MIKFDNKCYVCKCPQFSEGDTCPCECHEAFAKVLRGHNGNKEEATKAIEEIKMLIQTDAAARADYIQVKVKHIMDQIFKSENR